jgi:Fur family transcriptional regulator, ferric uptake regulator
VAAKSSVEQASARLRKTGERITEPRVRVLAALMQARNPVSHHELEAELAPIDKVTLYRVLEWLVARQIAHRVSGGDRIWRFGVADPRHEQHAHFECSHCSKVVCLADVPSRSLAVSVPRGYRLEGLELTAKGLCIDCA